MNAMQDFAHAPPVLRVFSREEVRSVDAAAGEEFAIPGIVLMENASAAIEEAALAMIHEQDAGLTIIVCGPGNNGGDGLATARRLANRGLAVGVALAVPPEKYKGDALTNLRIVERMDLPIHVLDSEKPGGSLRRIAALWLGRSCADGSEDDLLVLDALLGTGLTSPVRQPMDELVEAIGALRSGGASVLAVDIPTGLDCDTGEPIAGSACVRADATITLAGLKKGMTRDASRAWTGPVVVGDIGAPRKLLERLGVAASDN